MDGPSLDEMRLEDIQPETNPKKEEEKAFQKPKLTLDIDINNNTKPEPTRRRKREAILRRHFHKKTVQEEPALSSPRMAEEQSRRAQSTGRRHPGSKRREELIGQRKKRLVSLLPHPEPFKIDTPSSSVDRDEEQTSLRTMSTPSSSVDREDHDLSLVGVNASSLSSVDELSKTSSGVEETKRQRLARKKERWSPIMPRQRREQPPTPTPTEEATSPTEEKTMPEETKEVASIKMTRERKLEKLARHKRKSGSALRGRFPQANEEPEDPSWDPTRNVFAVEQQHESSNNISMFDTASWAATDTSFSNIVREEEKKEHVEDCEDNGQQHVPNLENGQDGLIPSKALENDTDDRLAKEENGHSSEVSNAFNELEEKMDAVVQAPDSQSLYSKESNNSVDDRTSLQARSSLLADSSTSGMEEMTDDTEVSQNRVEIGYISTSEDESDQNEKSVGRKSGLPPRMELPPPPPPPGTKKKKSSKSNKSKMRVPPADKTQPLDRRSVVPTREETTAATLRKAVPTKQRVVDSSARTLQVSTKKSAVAKSESMHKPVRTKGAPVLSDSETVNEMAQMPVKEATLASSKPGQKTRHVPSKKAPAFNNESIPEKSQPPTKSAVSSKPLGDMLFAPKEKAVAVDDSEPVAETLRAPAKRAAVIDRGPVQEPSQVRTLVATVVSSESVNKAQAPTKKAAATSSKPISEKTQELTKKADVVKIESMQKPTQARTKTATASSEPTQKMEQTATKEESVVNSELMMAQVATKKAETVASIQRMVKMAPIPIEEATVTSGRPFSEKDQDLTNAATSVGSKPSLDLKQVQSKEKVVVSIRSADQIDQASRAPISAKEATVAKSPPLCEEDQYLTNAAASVDSRPSVGLQQVQSKEDVVGSGNLAHDNDQASTAPIPIQEATVTSSTPRCEEDRGLENEGASVGSKPLLDLEQVQSEEEGVVSDQIAQASRASIHLEEATVAKSPPLCEEDQDLTNAAASVGSKPLLDLEQVQSEEEGVVSDQIAQASRASIHLEEATVAKSPPLCEEDQDLTNAAASVDSRPSVGLQQVQSKEEVVVSDQIAQASAASIHLEEASVASVGSKPFLDLEKVQSEEERVVSDQIAQASAASIHLEEASVASVGSKPFLDLEKVQSEEERVVSDQIPQASTASIHLEEATVAKSPPLCEEDQDLTNAAASVGSKLSLGLVQVQSKEDVVVSGNLAHENDQASTAPIPTKEATVSSSPPLCEEDRGLENEGASVGSKPSMDLELVQSKEQVFFSGNAAHEIDHASTAPIPTKQATVTSSPPRCKEDRGSSNEGASVSSKPLLDLEQVQSEEKGVVSGKSYDEIDQASMVPIPIMDVTVTSSQPLCEEDHGLANEGASLGSKPPLDLEQSQSKGKVVVSGKSSNEIDQASTASISIKDAAVPSSQPLCQEDHGLANEGASLGSKSPLDLEQSQSKEKRVVSSKPANEIDQASTKEASSVTIESLEKLDSESRREMDRSQAPDEAAKVIEPTTKSPAVKSYLATSDTVESPKINVDKTLSPASISAVLHAPKLAEKVDLAISVAAEKFEEQVSLSPRKERCNSEDLEGGAFSSWGNLRVEEEDRDSTNQILQSDIERPMASHTGEAKERSFPSGASGAPSSSQRTLLSDRKHPNVDLSPSELFLWLASDVGSRDKTTPASDTDSVTCMQKILENVKFFNCFCSRMVSRAKSMATGVAIEHFVLPEAANPVYARVLASTFVRFLDDIGAATGLVSPFGSENPFLLGILDSYKNAQANGELSGNREGTAKKAKSMQQIIFAHPSGEPQRLVAFAYGVFFVAPDLIPLPKKVNSATDHILESIRAEEELDRRFIFPDSHPSPFESAITEQPRLLKSIIDCLGDPTAVCRVKMINKTCYKYVAQNEHVLMRDAVRAGGLHMSVRPYFWLWVTLEKCSSAPKRYDDAASYAVAGSELSSLEHAGRESKWHHVIERDVSRAFGNLPPHKTGARLRTDSIVRALVTWGRNRMMKGVRGSGDPPLQGEDDDVSLTPTDTVSDWGGVTPVGSFGSSHTSAEDEKQKVKVKNPTRRRRGKRSPEELALNGNALTEDMKRTLQDKLSFILHALAAAHEDVGYCQGMDYVVAHLLRILQDTVRWKAATGTLPRIIQSAPKSFYGHDFDEQALAEMYAEIDRSLVLEETCFRVMDSFLSTYDLRHFYWPELRCLKTCCLVFEKLIQIKLPVLADHFEHHELNVGLFALGWFQTLFLYLPSMPSATVCHMWDIWLVERSFKIFFRVGTAILFLSQPILLNHELEGMMSYLNTFPDATLLSPDILIHCALQIKVTNRMLMELEQEVNDNM